MAHKSVQLLTELRSFIEGFGKPRILVDLDYRVLAANRAYCEQYSPRESGVGRRCFRVSHRCAVPCDQVGESCTWRAALASGRAERLLHGHHTPGGEEHVQIEVSPVRDGTGEIACFVARMDSPPAAFASAPAQGLVGRSPAFVETIALVTQVAPTATAVLLLGETGTGNEPVARSIQESNRRPDAPFVPVECSGPPDALAGGELFGHEKGPFTGAGTRKLGLVEVASDGTRFLDEVGDIPLEQQVKVLRLLKTRHCRRVNGV